MGTLNGRTALVTGGSRGIGRAVALRLAAEGAFVAVHYGSDADAAKRTVGDIERAGGRAVAIQAPFDEDDAVDRLFDALVPALDGRGLDILVNNAGIGSASPAATLTRGEFDRLMKVNVAAPFFVVQRALPLLNDGGRIVNMGSVASRVAVPVQIGYTVTKAALEALARPSPTSWDGAGSRSTRSRPARSAPT